MVHNTHSTILLEGLGEETVHTVTDDTDRLMSLRLNNGSRLWNDRTKVQRCRRPSLFFIDDTKSKLTTTKKRKCTVLKGKINTENKIPQNPGGK
jgi:hypothetical protein